MGRPSLHLSEVSNSRSVSKVSGFDGMCLNISPLPLPPHDSILALLVVEDRLSSVSSESALCAE